MDDELTDKHLHLVLGEGALGPNKFNLILNVDGFTVDGKVFGDEDDTCYMPIFAADTPDGRWLLGGVVI